MKILFLDIDGVLNSVAFTKTIVRRSLIADPATIDPQAVALLQNFLNQYSDLKIVISSTWRKAHTLSELKNILLHSGLNSDLIIEYTPVVHNAPRGAEIKQWLQTQNFKSNFPVTGIAILDDDTDMAELSPFLVQTNVEVGLQPADLPKVATTLQKPVPKWF